jgi:hypothetical protein
MVLAHARRVRRADHAYSGIRVPIGVMRFSTLCPRSAAAVARRAVERLIQRVSRKGATPLSRKGVTPFNYETSLARRRVNS